MDENKGVQHDEIWQLLFAASLGREQPHECLSWSYASLKSELGYGERMLGVKYSFVAREVAFDLRAQNSQWYASEEEEGTIQKCQVSSHSGVFDSCQLCLDCS